MLVQVHWASLGDRQYQNNQNSSTSITTTIRGIPRTPSLWNSPSSTITLFRIMCNNVGSESSFSLWLHLHLVVHLRILLCYACSKMIHTCCKIRNSHFSQLRTASIYAPISPKNYSNWTHVFVHTQPLLQVVPLIQRNRPLKEQMMHGFILILAQNTSSI